MKSRVWGWSPVRGSNGKAIVSLDSWKTQQRETTTTTKIQNKTTKQVLESSDESYQRKYK